MFRTWLQRSRGVSIWGVIGLLMLGFLGGCGGGSDDPPRAPAGLTAAAGDSQVTLTWTVSSKVSSYNLYWSTTAGVTTSTGTKITGVTAPFAHTGLTNGQAYYYVLTAVNSNGESKPSAEASATLAPSAPGTVSAVSGDEQVTVDWRDTFGATSYNLYWSNTPGVTKTTGTKIEDVSAPFAHTALTNGTAYYYVVTAVGAGGESADSEQVSATPQVPVPGAPINVTAILTPETTKSVTVTWSPPGPPTDPADILSYNLYRSTTADIAADLSVATKFEGVASPYIDVVPAGQVTYYYVVTAVTAGGEGAPSAEVSATPKGSPSGGGDTGFGNNLSVPLLFADGIGITGATITGTDYTDLATGLRPTATDITDPFPYFNAADIFTLNSVDYYEQQSSSTWQASWVNGKGSVQQVEADWGDNLVSANLRASQVIRVETVLRQYKGGTSWADTESMSGYPMTLLYGQGIAEMQGTTGTAVDATERRVYAVTPRLKIQKLVGGVPTDHECGFDGSIAEGLALPDGSDVPKYAAEINVGGSLTYGFNWFINQCVATDKTGTWRITFSFDDWVTVGGERVDNNTRIESLHSSETSAVLENETTTYIDVVLN